MVGVGIDWDMRTYEIVRANVKNNKIERANVITLISLLTQLWAFGGRGGVCEEVHEEVREVENNEIVR
jgi:hypothetical protein